MMSLRLIEFLKCTSEFSNCSPVSFYPFNRVLSSRVKYYESGSPQKACFG